MRYTALFLSATMPVSPSVSSFGSRDQWTGNFKIMFLFRQDIPPTYCFFQGKGQIGRNAIKSINLSGNNPTSVAKSTEEFTLPSRESDSVGLAWGPGMYIFYKATQVILRTNAQELVSNSKVTQHWEQLLKNNQGNVDSGKLDNHIL